MTAVCRTWKYFEFRDLGSILGKRNEKKKIIKKKIIKKKLMKKCYFVLIFIVPDIILPVSFYECICKLNS